MNEIELSKLGSVYLVDINKIKPNTQQPRVDFDESKLLELSESIKQYGVSAE